MTIEDIVIKKYKSINVFQSVKLVKQDLFKESFLVVHDENDKFVDLLTPADLLNNSYNIVADCISPKPIINLDDNLNDIIGKFTNSSLSALPVFYSNEFFGVLMLSRLLEFLVMKMPDRISQNNSFRFSDNNSFPNIAYMQYSGEHRRFHLSPNWEKITGISPEQMSRNPKESWAKFMDTTNDSHITDDINKYMRSEIDYIDHFIKINHPQKGLVWIQLFVWRRGKNQKNQSKNTLAIVKDLSEFKSLLDLETRIPGFHDILDKSDSLLYLVDEKGECKYVNEAFLKQFNYNKQQVLGKPFQNFFPEDLAMRVAKTNEEIAVSGESKTYEQYINTNGKYEVFISNKTPLYNKDKQLKGFFCILSNISDLKRIEVELKNINHSLKITNEQLKEELSLQKKLHNENSLLREELRELDNYKKFNCEDRNFKKIINSVLLVSPTDTTVLISGETGTGKELIADFIHKNSNRRDKPIVKINCTAIPDGLVESELFGHEKGAFTGAHQRKIGKFEYANGGTIFLDEVGDLPASIQPKLLRVLQENSIVRIGGNETIKVDVRILSATNKDLFSEIKKGKFREDLFYRLNVFPVKVPPLRERKKDIPLLVNYFVKKHNSRNQKSVNFISQYIMDKILTYYWPGNIRELENFIERALIISKGDKLTIDGLLPENTAEIQSEEIFTLENMERNHILKVLERASWKISGTDGAANLLGINRSTLNYRMKKLGISYQKLTKQ